MSQEESKARKACSRLQLLGAAASATGREAGAGWSWPAVLPGVTQSVQATDGGFETSLSLADRAAAVAPVRFALSVPAGASAAVRPGPGSGTVQVTDSSGQPVGSVGAAFLRDAHGKTSTALTYSLTAGPAGGYVLTVTPPAGWLSAPDRAFPVLLDPYVTVAGAPSTSAVRIDGQNPTSNYASSYLAVGYDGGQTARTLLRFDMTGIPDDAQVQSALLTVGTDTTDTAVNNPSDVYALTQPWTSAATWNTTDGTTAWASPGGSTDPVQSWRTDLPGYGGAYTSYGVTKIVRGWVDGSRDNNGLLLRSVLEGYDGSGNAHMDYLGAIGSSTGPALAVQWTARIGQHPGAQFLTRKLDDHLTLNVDYGNGNLLLTATDLSMATPGLPTAVTRTYNSRGETLNGAGSIGGVGWTLAPGPDQNAHGYADSKVTRTPDGAQHPYDQPEGAFTASPPPGADADLRTDNALVNVTTDRVSQLVTSYNTSRQVDSTSCLTSLKDRNGNTLSVTYGTVSAGSCAQNTSLTDTSGRTWPVHWNGTAASSLIDTVTDPSGRAVHYSYTGLDP